jgi:hypothetical protein
MLRSSSQRRGCSLLLKAMLVCSALFFVGTALTVLTASWVTMKISGVPTHSTPPLIKASTSPVGTNNMNIQQQNNGGDEYRLRPRPVRKRVPPTVDVPPPDTDIDSLPPSSSPPPIGGRDDFIDDQPVRTIPPLDIPEEVPGLEHEVASSTTDPAEANTEWFDELIRELANERLLTKNIKSKEHMWRALPPPKRMEHRPHALVYLGGYSALLSLSRTFCECIVSLMSNICWYGVIQVG